MKKRTLAILLGKKAPGSEISKGAKSVRSAKKRTPGRTKREDKGSQLEMPFTKEDTPIMGSKGKPDKSSKNVDIVQDFLDTIGGKKELSDVQKSAYDQMMRRAFKD